MKKLLILVVLLIALPMMVAAQSDRLSRNSYLRNDNPGGLPPTKEPNNPLPGLGWTGPYAPGPIAPAWEVLGSGDIYIGLDNEFRWVSLKTVTITVSGTGGIVWQLANVTADGTPAAYKVVNETYDGANVSLTIEIFRQPDWEVIILHNGGTLGTITSITAFSDCVFIPSLTHYGLGILALLLIGSTVWVLRRRRVGSVAKLLTPTRQ